jgi:hypothetical protein
MDAYRQLSPCIMAIADALSKGEEPKVDWKQHMKFLQELETDLRVLYSERRRTEAALRETGQLMSYYRDELSDVKERERLRDGR